MSPAFAILALRPSILALRPSILALRPSILAVRPAILALSFATLALSPGTAVAANPIQIENAKAGDSHWTAATQDPSGSAIEGYASATSVRPGEMIGFHVSTTPAARYRIEIDRLGWYGGSGGRRVSCLVSSSLDPSCSRDEAGAEQPAPGAPDPVTGELEVGWPVTDTLAVPASWTSGYYLAVFRLTSGPSAGQTGYTPFIVQAPAGEHSAILVQVPSNTWQAYNTWGGEDLYTQPRAVKVSFDRPYALEGPTAVPAGHGGGLFNWEYPLIRFLERGGWDLSYATDDDVDRDPSILLNHALDMTAGHDEYWTKQMRDGWEAARAAGVNLAFMGANTGYWQVRYEDGDRTMVGYKTSPDPDPDPTTQTVQFRQLNPPRPECELEGVQFAGAVLYGQYFDYAVAPTGATDPWFSGTGLTAGAPLTGLVGGETDAVDPGCHVPPPVTLLGYSGPPVAAGTPPVTADSVRYTACSGAEVFSAGSLQFSWGLDSWRAPAYSTPGFPPPPPASAGLQQAMTQALADLTQSHVPLPGPPQICVPTSSFDTSVPLPSVGQPVQLTSTATDQYGQIARQAWDLSGGGTFTDATGATAIRSFAEPGVYRVGLQVTDASGAQSTTTKTISVCTCPAAPRAAAPSWPVAEWNGRACQGAAFGTAKLAGGRLRFSPDPGITRFTLRAYSLALRPNGHVRRRLLSARSARSSTALALHRPRAAILIEVSTIAGGARISNGYLLPARTGRRRPNLGALDGTACDGASAHVLTPLFGGPRSRPLRVAVTGTGTGTVRATIAVRRLGRPTRFSRAVSVGHRARVISVRAARLAAGPYMVTISSRLGGRRESFALAAVRVRTPASARGGHR